VDLDPKAAYEARSESQILDVRESFEWKMGHIEGALHIPMKEIPSRLDEIQGTGPIIAVCRSGNRSAQVTRLLKDNGFEVHNLDGGLKAWSNSGLPVVNRKGKAGRVV
jgi:rhodanese-related sulfurtransferase